MHIIIESAIGGDIAGFLQCTLSGNESISSLISIFCESKGLPVNPDFVLKDKRGVTLDCRKRVLDYDIVDGDTIYLENNDIQSGMFRFTNWWLLATGAILLAVVGFATVLSLHILKGPTPSEFGVVLDGGSSHTALFIYRWDGPKWMGTGVLQQIGACNVPGDITSYYKNISGIDAFLSPCLSYASGQVPAANRPTTPIFFGGTAGFRLLNISQPGGADILLDGIRNQLSRSGFQFDPSYVEILSGRDEAQFSWITVNTQLHNFGPNDSDIRLRHSSGATVGALDLGGASTQLSMQMPAGHHGTSGQTDGLWKEDGHTSLELYGRNYSVYSHSSLCYGVLETVKRYQSMLVAGQNVSTVVVESPCHPVGYSGRVQADKIFSSPCARNRSASWTADQWIFNGTGNYAKCSYLMDGLFNTSYCRAHFLPPTCFDSQGQPPVARQDFLAFSGFNLVARDLNITNTSTLDDFQRAVRNVCNMTWDQLLQLPIEVSNSSFASLLCLQSQYVLSLLTSGYGFDNTSWPGLHFVKQILGTDVGWAMGYMTERTNRIAASEATILLGLPAFVALTLLFTLFFVVGLFLAYHAGRMKRSAHSYSRILLLRMDDELERFLPVCRDQS